MTEQQSIELMCPLCGSRHPYRLNVAYAVVHGYEQRGRRPAAQPSERRFRRYFVCPSKSERFVATVVLEETARRPIEELVVDDADGQG
jgi:hypothetical protein